MTREDKIKQLMTAEGVCDCGKTHKVSLRRIVMRKGALSSLQDVINALGNYEKVAMIADANTFEAAGKYVLVSCELNGGAVVLDPENLHANERAVAAAEAKLGECDLLVAVGSGTVHDVTRYIAHKRGIDFVSVPTAASVDGFVSGVAAMTWNGVKLTLPARSPIAMVADADVIAKAPVALTAAGVGDLLGKYTALLDWRISHILTGEPLCEHVVDLENEAISEVVSHLSAIRAGDPDAIEALTYGLVLSGLAMQMVGNSRPASGAEHHISHLLEMGTLIENHAYHGEKVGVATALVADRYHEIFVPGLSGSDFLPFNGFDEKIKDNFGALAAEVAKESVNDPLEKLTPGTILSHWNELCALVAALPTGDEIRTQLDAVGGSKTLSDIGVPDELLPKLYDLSPLVRNRLTGMRLSHLFRC